MSNPENSLGAAYASFVPIDRRFALAYGESIPERANGAALIGDLSGFTPLVVELRVAYGAKRASEEITEYLNLLFMRLIDVAHEFGGSVIGFSGDGITCWFDGDDGHYATAAAMRIREAVHDIPVIQLPDRQSHRAGIKIAVGAGEAWRYLVGDPAIQRFEVLAGPLVDRIDAILQLTMPGEVAAGEEIQLALGDTLHTSTVRGGEAGPQWVVCEDFAVEPFLKPWPALPPIQAARFRPWVLNSIAERLEAGGDAMLAEVRPVIALFLHLEEALGDREYNDDIALDQYVRFVQRTVTELEGDLIELSIGDKGNYFYIVFGATVAHEDDEHRAVRAAIALRRPRPGVEIGHSPRIGISSGEMRVGTYGSAVMRHFGVQGLEVNIAARLMMNAAPGEILISQRVADAVARSIFTESAGDLTLKGMHNTLPAHRVIREREDLIEDLHRFGKVPLVGRFSELAILTAALDRVAGGDSELALLEGPAGIGKSRMLAELASIAEKKGVVTWFSAVEEIDRRRPCYIWSHIGRAAFGIAAGDSSEVVREKIACHLPAGTDTDNLLPLLNSLFAMRLPETPLTESLTGKLRADRTKDLLLAALEHARGDRSVLIVLEDAHWMDALSLSAVASVCERISKTLVIVSSRDVAGSSELASIVEKRNGTHLHLDALDQDSTRALVAWRLGVEDLPDDLANHIYAASGGQPFFAEELAFALQDAGLIKITKGECVVAVSHSLDEVEFPSTLQGIITSRLDKLAQSQQLVLKIASVIGHSFDLATLEHLHPDRGASAWIRTDLDALSRMGVTTLVRPEPTLTHMFRHALLRDVVYRRLLSTQRRELHRGVCSWYEHEHKEDLRPFYTVLAYHWQAVVSSGDSGSTASAKAIDYLRRSGGEAMRSGMPKDAVAFGMDAVRLMGVDLPLERAAVADLIDSGEKAIEQALAGRPPGALIDLKPMEDAQHAQVVETLLELMPAAFMARMEDVFALAAITNLKLTIVYGTAPMSPIVYSMYAVLRRTQFKDIDGADAFSRLALELDERQGRHCFGVCAFIHCRFVNLWCNPLQDSIPFSMEGAQAALARGQVLYGCFNLSLYVQYSAATGTDLQELKKIAREKRDFVNRRVLSSTFHCILELQFAKALAGETEHRFSMTDSEHDEHIELASILETDLYNQMAFYHVARLKLNTYHGAYDEALISADSAFEVLPASAGQVVEMELRFFFAVAALGAFTTADRQRRVALRARAQEQARIIRGWRIRCEANFGHLVGIVDGRLASTDGRDDVAVRLLENAATGAQAGDYIQHAALAYELLARHHLSCSRPEAARAAFKAAADAYGRWGATTKLEDMQAQVPVTLR